ncbi:MAG: hypothetical protein AB8B53_10140 [Flavobacteriales bacterium]
MDHSEQLEHIEKLMQRSTRFISLSGLSGISAGIIALIGSAWAKSLVDTVLKPSSFYSRQDASVYAIHSELIIQLFFIAAAVLLLSGLIVFYFSFKRARKIGVSIWDQSARRLLSAFFPPMIVGGVFCLALLYYGVYVLIVPATLLFYGLALLSSSAFTLDEIKFLGLSEIILGVASAFLPQYAYYFWSLGFGVLHIAYGAVMYFKYERSST